MGYLVLRHGRITLSVFALAFALTGTAGFAQDAAESAEPAPADQASQSTIPVEPVQAPAAPNLSASESAAKSGATELDAVEVTGSRIRRTDYESAQPVMNITRKDIERAGMTTIGDLLQSLPGAGAALNTNFNNGGTGATNIDLRNLGSSRVLVLVNGHRWVTGLSTLNTGSVDLNTVPIAIVDHVEILQDGASAIYGSDAIAGVVNIITRKTYEGLQFGSQAGMYTEGDGLQHAHHVSYGRNLGSTNIFGDISYQQQKAIMAADREISRLPKYGTGLTRGSSFLPEGRLLFLPTVLTGAQLGGQRCPNAQGGLIQAVFDDPAGTVGDPLASGDLPAIPVTVPPQVGEIPAGIQICDISHTAGTDPDSISSYHPVQLPEEAYNYALDNYLSTPLETMSAFAAISHQLTDSINLNAELLYHVRRSRQELAPQPLCIGSLCPIIGGSPTIDGVPSAVSYNQATYVPAGSPFNPFGQDIGRPDPTDPQNLLPATQTACKGVVGACPGDGAILRRPVEIGRRIQEQEVKTPYVHLAFSGNAELFSRLFNWELGYGLGRSEQTSTLQNQTDMSRLQKAVIGGDDCTGDCVPVNMVGGIGSLTPEMISYINFTGVEKTTQQQSDYYGNIGTEFSDVPLPAPLGVAMGFEIRKDKLKYTPDEHTQNGTTSGLTAQPTAGSVRAKEFYAELQVPLLREMPFAHKLDLNLAGRISNYANFGSSRNGKVGLEYRPFEDLLVRSTFSSSFRAPDVGNLYLGAALSYPGVADPCDTASTDSPRNSAGSNAETNCNADGVPDDLAQAFVQTPSPYVGNPNLKPETSHSFTAGLVFNPESIPDLTMSLDYFQISVEDFITANDAQSVVDNCYTSAPDSRRDCGNIRRNASTGQLELIQAPFENFPRIETAGFDFNVDYILPTQGALPQGGRFKVVLNTTFLSSYSQFLVGDHDMIEKEGLAGQNTGDTAYPRWKINPSFQWSKDQWQASWNVRIIWKQVESCFDGIDPSLADLGLCSDPNHKSADDGSSDPLNEIKTTARHDVQLGYSIPDWKADIVFGVENIFDTDPPVSRAAFANSFDASDYWIPGVVPYLQLKMDIF